MNLVDIAVLVETVQAGSLAAAARRLGITPMAASRSLAALEAEIGVRLMHRTTRSTALTAEGEAFLPFAQTMLENEADGVAAIRPSAAGATGLLRVTASAAFGRKMVIPMMADFLADNPALRADLILSDALLDLAAHGIDVAIRIAQLHDSDLIARQLAANPRALYASPDYLKKAGIPRTIPDLQQHQCLSFPGDTHWAFSSGSETIRIRPNSRFTASSMDGLHEACRLGMGITLLSEWDAKDQAQSGDLQQITLQDATPVPLIIWAVYPTARMVPMKVRTFIAAFSAYLRNTGSA